MYKVGDIVKHTESGGLFVVVQESNDWEDSWIILPYRLWTTSNEFLDKNFKPTGRTLQGEGV